jgi:ABC-type phosphate transport system substrate-binding protein
MKIIIRFRFLALLLGALLTANLGFAAIAARGSDSTIQAVKALAEAFQKKSGAVIQVDGGGSGSGARAAIAGEVQLAFLSRALTVKEKEAGLIGTDYASDALSVHATFATKGDASGPVKEFIEFSLSPEGQMIVAQNGFLAVK